MAGSSTSTRSAHGFSLGINTTQCLIGDEEIFGRFQFNHHCLLFSVGYDFNFLDHGRHLDREDQKVFWESVEEEDNPDMRYFWGNGSVFRLGYEYHFTPEKNNSFVLSSMLMLKERRYSNYHFGERGTRHVFSETGGQVIYGLSLLAGFEFQRGIVCIKPHTGIGIRYVKREIIDPDIIQGNTIVVEGKNFTEERVYPTLHLGLVILFRVKG